eukprot:TRINITY_DN3878_c0_g1_i2.p1 TRINITY_DN3878_c0_g1~~TRINITY_DN3878_c0_g1_i2.p1  ORF type:complete len:800 (+),score=83.91 TRINITY_DN3878_c0_g1_i2:181-2580(+)
MAIEEQENSVIGLIKIIDDSRRADREVRLTTWVKEDSAHKHKPLKSTQTKELEDPQDDARSLTLYHLPSKPVGPISDGVPSSGPASSHGSEGSGGNSLGRGSIQSCGSDRGFVLQGGAGAYGSSRATSSMTRSASGTALSDTQLSDTTRGDIRGKANWKAAFRQRLQEEQASASKSARLARSMEGLSKSWSLLTSFIFICVVVLVGGCVLVAVVSRQAVYNQQNRTASDLASGAQGTTTNMVISQLSLTHSLMAEEIRGVDLGITDLSNIQVRDFTWKYLYSRRTSGAYNETQAIYYADTTGSFLAIESLSPAPPHSVAYISPGVGKKSLRLGAYSITENGGKLRDWVIQTDPSQDTVIEGFSVLGRPWYTSAVEKGSPVWSPPYLFQDPPVLGVTYSTPHIDKNGTVSGVFGIDLVLVELSYLLQRTLSSLSNVYIFESSGALLATTFRNQGLSTVNGSLMDPGDAREPLIYQSYRYLRESVPDLTAIPIEGISGRTFIDGVDSLILARPLDLPTSKPWIVVSVVSVGTKQSALIDLVAIHSVVILLGFVVAVVLSVWLSDRTRVSCAFIYNTLKSDDLDLEYYGHKFKEFQVLQESVNVFLYLRRVLWKTSTTEVLSGLSRIGQLSQLGLETRTASFVSINCFSEPLDQDLYTHLRAKVIAHNGILDIQQTTSTSFLVHFGVVTENDTHLADSYKFAKEMLRASAEGTNPTPLAIVATTGTVLAGNIGIRYDQRYSQFGTALNELTRIESVVQKEDHSESALYVSKQYVRLHAANEIDILASFSRIPSDKSIFALDM